MPRPSLSLCHRALLPASGLSPRPPAPQISTATLLGTWGLFGFLAGKLVHLVLRPGLAKEGLGNGGKGHCAGTTSTLVGRGEAGGAGGRPFLNLLPLLPLFIELGAHLWRVVLDYGVEGVKGYFILPSPLVKMDAGVLKLVTP